MNIKKDFNQFFLLPKSYFSMCCDLIYTLWMHFEAQNQWSNLDLCLSFASQIDLFLFFFYGTIKFILPLQVLLLLLNACLMQFVNSEQSILQHSKQ